MDSEKTVEEIFAGCKEVTARAYVLGQRLNMRGIRDYPVLKASPYMIVVGSGVAVLFRFGVVVLFGLEGAEKDDFLTHVKEHIIQENENFETESVILKKNDVGEDRVLFDSIYIQSWDIDRLLVIADVLAKSQVLNYHELQVSASFDKLEPVTYEMQTKGYPSRKRTSELLRNVATTLATQRNISGQVEILDKPDFLWDKPPAIEGLFVRLEDEYELRERHSALKEKLELIYRTSEMMLTLMNSRHTLHVEWYIVILIIIDIVIHVAETYIF